MRASLARVLTTGVVVLGSLAWASPAMAVCETQVVQAFTVGVGGQDLATTPRVVVSWCGESRYFTPPPTVTVEQYGDESYGVYLDFPGGGPLIDWTFGVEIDGEYREVVLPDVEPGGPTGRTCLLYYGFDFHNPGNCLAHLEHP